MNVVVRALGPSFLHTLESVALVVLVASAAGHAQGTGAAAPQAPTQAPSPQPPPVFRAGVNFVRLDVIATDQTGRPVEGLVPADFEVFEEGQAQTVETLKYFALNGGLTAGEPPRQILRDLDEAEEAAREDVRLLAFFLDDYSVQWRSAVRMREQLARFVETQVGPSDMIGVMVPLQPIASLRFSRNHRAIAATLSGFIGRRFDYTPQNGAEAAYSFCPAEVVEAIRQQVSLSALQSLIVRLGTLKEGRKAVVLVSEGYPDAMVGAARLSNCGRISTAGSDVSFEFRDVIAHANRYNVAIYTVDPQGLVMASGSGIESLRVLAYDTDGQPLVNRNEVTLPMKAIVQDLSSYYLLGYSSTLAGDDGKFHDIRVRVKRPGVRVRARRGYWAISEEDLQKPLPGFTSTLPKTYTDALDAVRTPRSRSIRSLLATAPGPDGASNVTVIWEPAPTAAGRPRAPGEAPARVLVRAQAADGAPIFTGRAVSAPAGRSGGHVAFSAPPGSLEVRLSVEDLSGAVLDTESVQVDVPDYGGGAARFSTPLVWRSRSLREFEQLQQDAQALPAASREFLRGERLLVRVRRTGANERPPTAYVLGPTGNRIGQPAVTGPVDGDVWQIDLPLSAMAPGEYVLEVSDGPDGATPAIVAFRITG